MHDGDGTGHLLRTVVAAAAVAAAGAVAAVALLALLDDRREARLPAEVDPVDETRETAEHMEAEERQNPPSEERPQTPTGERQRPPGGGERPGGLIREHAGPVVVAVLAVLLVAAAMDFIHGRADGKDDKPAAAEASAETAAKDAAPRFVVGVRRSGDALVVRDARTGAQVGVDIAAPVGRRFHQIASAGEGTFVVSSYASGQVTFHRLALTPDGLPRSLTPLEGLQVRGVSTGRSDMAVSPDGRRIAYLVYGQGVSRIEVVSADAAAQRRWTSRSTGRITNLAWSGDALSFVWSTGGGSTVRRQVRTLDVNAPSGDLRVSKALLPLPADATTVALVRGDAVVAGIQRGATLSLQEFSVQTRQPTREWWTVGTARSPVALVRASVGEEVLLLSADGLAHGAPGGKAHAIPVEDCVDVAW